MDSVQAQSLLFIWVYGPKHAPGFPGDVLSLLNTIIQTIGNMDSIANVAISSTDETKVLLDDLLSRLNSLLQSPQELDGNLRAYLILIHRLCNVSGIFPSDRGDSARGLLAESVCIACQRQLCSGDITFDDLILELCLRNIT